VESRCKRDRSASRLVSVWSAVIDHPRTADVQPRAVVAGQVERHGLVGFPRDHDLTGPLGGEVVRSDAAGEAAIAWHLVYPPFGLGDQRRQILENREVARWVISGPARRLVVTGCQPTRGDEHGIRCGQQAPRVADFVLESDPGITCSLEVLDLQVVESRCERDRPASGLVSVWSAVIDHPRTADVQPRAVVAGQVERHGLVGFPRDHDLTGPLSGKAVCSHAAGVAALAPCLVYRPFGLGHLRRQIRENREVPSSPRIRRLVVTGCQPVRDDEHGLLLLDFLHRPPVQALVDVGIYLALARVADEQGLGRRIVMGHRAEARGRLRTLRGRRVGGIAERLGPHVVVARQRKGTVDGERLDRADVPADVSVVVIFLIESRQSDHNPIVGDGHGGAEVVKAGGVGRLQSPGPRGAAGSGPTGAQSGVTLRGQLVEDPGSAGVVELAAQRVAGVVVRAADHHVIAAEGHGRTETRPGLCLGGVLFRQSAVLREAGHAGPRCSRALEDKRPAMLVLARVERLGVPLRGADDDPIAEHGDGRPEFLASLGLGGKKKGGNGGPCVAAARIDPRSAGCDAGIRAVGRTDHGGSADHGHGGPEIAAAVGQLGLLAPRGHAAGENVGRVRRHCGRGPARRAHEDRTAADRHGLAEGLFRTAVARPQLGLLPPNPIRTAGKNIGRARVVSHRVVLRGPDDQAVAVDGDRLAEALPRAAAVAGIQLGLLDPGAAAPGVDVDRADRQLLPGGAHHQRVPAHGHRPAHLLRLLRPQPCRDVQDVHLGLLRPRDLAVDGQHVQH